MRRTILAATAALLAMPVAASAQQTNPATERTQRVEFGRLECNIEGGIGFIIGSSKDMVCMFHPAGDRPPQQFVGKVNKFGLDIGITGETVMQWIVLAPTDSDMSAAALAGTYVGASAEASAAIGVGANVLIGGSSDSFALQPVSVQGQTGINVALGVTSFELVAVN